MAETKPKTAEYRYKLTVSRARKINLGNYESQDEFESLTEGFDNFEDITEVRQRIISSITESMDGRVMMLGNFKLAAELPPRPDIAPKESGISMPKVSTFTDGKITECADLSDLWPPTIPCRECGKLVDRRDSKFPGNPYYYKCECGKMNFSKGYKPKNGGK